MANALPQRASVTSADCPTDGSLDEYNYSSNDYPKSVLKGLNDLRDDAVFCDVILRVGEQTFPAHKNVLVTFSPYFKAMFTSQLKESHDREVTLNDIEPEILEALLQFAYTGAVSITQANVQSLMAASNLLQVLLVRDACSVFMEKHMDASNCLGIRCFAETMDCERLQEAAKAFTFSNLTDVATHEEFLNLSTAKLVELVSSDAMDVPEEDVFTAVLNWLNQQPDTRKEGFHEVLENVRLSLMSPYFLQDCVGKHEILRKSPECRDLVDEARLYHCLPDRRRNMPGVRFRPRRNAELVDVIVCVGGHDGQKILDCVEAFDPASNQWSSLRSLPSAVRLHRSVVAGKNVLYVAGGKTPSADPSNQLLRFDPHLSTWVDMASMFSARSHHGMAVLDGFLYVVGGCSGTARLDSVERYNTETNTWEQLPGLKAGISSAAVVAHDGYLYVAGGITSEKLASSVVHEFDPRSRTWSELAPMPTPRYGSAACILAGKLYIIGGRKGTDYSNTVECYDIHKKQWSPCSPMRAERWWPDAAVINGHINVFGGKKGPDMYLKSVERYLPSADRWEDATDMPEALWGLTSTTLQVPRSLLTSTANDD